MSKNVIRDPCTWIAATIVTSKVADEKDATVNNQGAGYLLVCLCDLGGCTVQRGDWAGAEICSDHAAMKLRSLIEMDTQCILHVYDGDEIVPLKIPNKGKNQMPQTQTYNNFSIVHHQLAHADRLPEMPWDADEWSPLEFAGALCGEAGELANKCKKLRRGQDIKKEELAEEAADVFAYLCILCNILDINLAEAATKKFNDVSDRWGVQIKL